MLSQASGGGHGENESMFNMFMIGFTSSSSLRTQSSFTLLNRLRHVQVSGSPTVERVEFLFSLPGLQSSRTGKQCPWFRFAATAMESEWDDKSSKNPGMHPPDPVVWDIIICHKIAIYGKTFFLRQTYISLPVICNKTRSYCVGPRSCEFPSASITQGPHQGLCVCFPAATLLNYCIKSYQISKNLMT